jgi:hypothetical protein
MDQLREEIRDAVLGNAGTIITFRIGNRDAQILEPELTFSARHLSNLANRQVCVKLLDAGDYGEPFVGKTLPPMATRHGRRDNMIRRSREKYGTPRARIENKIQRWMTGREW